MKKIASLFLFFLLTFACPAATVSVGTASISANQLVGASLNTTTGVLVYGGTGATSDPSWAGKIVLLDRGPAGLTFAPKLQNVQSAGALGCIIADIGPPPADGLGFRGQLPTGTFSPLTVLLISQADGATLQAKVGTVVAIGANFVNVTPPPPAVTLPSMDGHAFEFLTNDGTKWFWSKIVFMGNSTSGSAKAGSGLSLIASADGAPPLTFQWSKDGNALSGATNQTYALAAVAAGDAGSYTCTVSNSGGSATSAPYALTVTP